MSHFSLSQWHEQKSRRLNLTNNTGSLLFSFFLSVYLFLTMFTLFLCPLPPSPSSPTFPFIYLFYLLTGRLPATEPRPWPWREASGKLSGWSISIVLTAGVTAIQGICTCLTWKEWTLCIFPSGKRTQTNALDGWNCVAGLVKAIEVLLWLPSRRIRTSVPNILSGAKGRRSNTRTPYQQMQHKWKRNFLSRRRSNGRRPTNAIWGIWVWPPVPRVRLRVRGRGETGYQIFHRQQRVRNCIIFFFFLFKSGKIQGLRWLEIPGPF